MTADIAIIPARGGSKRIPRKNVRPFAGIPMIAHAIRAAQAAGLFARVVVSTDDEEIAAVAREWGAEAPFRRPGDLADDMTPTLPVMAHAVQWCLDAGLAGTDGAACCIYPCVPLLRPASIVAARRRMIERGALYCVPVLRFEAPIQRALRLVDGGLEMFDPSHALTRSQDLEPAYHDAGQFYWGTVGAWLAQRPLFSGESAALVMDRREACDIDTPEDWAFAERLHQSASVSEP
jgi:pseudaminic acid cytidylyltransferase